MSIYIEKIDVRESFNLKLYVYIHTVHIHEINNNKSSSNYCRWLSCPFRIPNDV